MDGQASRRRCGGLFWRWMHRTHLPKRWRLSWPNSRGVSRSRKAGRVPIHVSVVHVMARQRLAPLTIRMTVPWIKSENKVKVAARRLVEQSAQQLTKAGFAAKPVSKIGNPAEEIMEMASKHHADLIVMGAKGLGTIDRVLLGSVSMQVMQYATCPVLVVR
jgi:nucleotide-binding universal stress UspA family protein